MGNEMDETLISYLTRRPAPSSPFHFVIPALAPMSSLDDITRDRRDEYHTSRSRSLHSEIAGWLAHSITYFETLHHRGRSISHVHWEVEINESAAAPNARMFSAQFWSMQFRKQWSPHTNSHYVISQCDDLICFQNDQIRGLQTYTCSRKSFASILDPDSLLGLSILNDDLLVNSNLQALSRAFRHLFAKQLAHIDRLENWEQWDTHEDLYFGGVRPEEALKVICFSNLSLVILLLWGSHYFEGVLDRVSFFFFLLSSSSRSLIWESIRLLSSKKSCMFYLFTHPPTSLIVYLALLWGSHWPGGVKSLLFYWFVGNDCSSLLLLVLI